MLKKNYQNIMKELRSRTYLYVTEEKLLYDAVMYNLKAVTYFKWLKIEHYYTTEKNPQLLYNF